MQTLFQWLRTRLAPKTLEAWQYETQYAQKLLQTSELYSELGADTDGETVLWTGIHPAAQGTRQTGTRVVEEHPECQVYILRWKDNGNG